MLRCSVISGLAVAFLASMSFAQPSQFFSSGAFPSAISGTLGSPTYAYLLLVMPEVMKELDMTDAQKANWNQVRVEGDKDAHAAMSGIDFQALQKMSQKELEKKQANLNTKNEEMRKKMEEKLEKILDEKQVKRLKQLQIQREGAAAFSRAEVLTKLGVSEEQKATIKNIQDTARIQREKAATSSRADAEALAKLNVSAEEKAKFKKTQEIARKQKMQEARVNLLKDLVAVLNEQQLATWKEMTGKEFEFPQVRSFSPLSDLLRR
jgi:hypothetical protein